MSFVGRPPQSPAIGLYREPDRLYDGYLFDLDDTIYLGDELLPGAKRLVQKSRELAKRTVPRRSGLSLLRSGLLRALQVLLLVDQTSSLLFIILISPAGLLSALSLLPDLRDRETLEGILAVVLNTLGVGAAWGVIHTSYALYYASRYYRSEESQGGIEFPGEGDPSSSTSPTLRLRSARASPSPTCR